MSMYRINCKLVSSDELPEVELSALLWCWILSMSSSYFNLPGLSQISKVKDAHGNNHNTKAVTFKVLIRTRRRCSPDSLPQIGFLRALCMCLLHTLVLSTYWHFLLCICLLFKIIFVNPLRSETMQFPHEYNIKYCGFTAHVSTSRD